MPIQLTPALLIGLGLRIVLDHLTRNGEAATIRDFALLGAWQGIGFHYSLRYPGISIIIAVIVLGKLFVDHNFAQDTTRTVTTLCGVVLGVMSSEILSQLFDPRTDAKPESSSRKRRLSTAQPPPRKDRSVQFEPGRHPDRSRGSANASKELRAPSVPQTVSDITSVESSSEFLGSTSSLSPRERLEREIKMLRTRASLADSERRRFKEERKWAVSAGNDARADQMKWQVKRYTALMQSFHREADIKLLEASTLRDEPSDLLLRPSAVQKSSSQQPRRVKESTPEPQHSPTFYTDPGPSSGKRRSVKPSREFIR